MYHYYICTLVGININRMKKKLTSIAQRCIAALRWSSLDHLQSSYQHDCTSTLVSREHWNTSRCLQVNAQMPTFAVSFDVISPVLPPVEFRAFNIGSERFHVEEKKASKIPFPSYLQDEALRCPCGIYVWPDSCCCSHDVVKSTSTSCDLFQLNHSWRCSKLVPITLELSMPCRAMLRRELDRFGDHNYYWNPSVPSEDSLACLRLRQGPSAFSAIWCLNKCSIKYFAPRFTRMIDLRCHH